MHGLIARDAIPGFVARDRGRPSAIGSQSAVALQGRWPAPPLFPEMWTTSKVMLSLATKPEPVMNTVDPGA